MEEIEGLDTALQQLETQRAKPTETTPDEDDDATDEDDDTEEAVDGLQKASEILRSTAILLEFLSDPTFCKGITKITRDAIDRQLAKVWDTVQNTEQLVAELSMEDTE